MEAKSGSKKRSKIVVNSIAIEHGDALRRFLRKKLSSDEEAEDLAQEAFIRLHSVEDISAIDNPRAYLYRIAANLIADKYRKQGNNVTLAMDDVDESEFLDGLADPVRTTLAREEIEILSQAILKLPERCQQVFILRKLHHIPNKEIGKRLGISVKTVENHITKGLALCHQYIIDFDKGYVTVFPAGRVAGGSLTGKRP